MRRIAIVIAAALIWPASAVVPAAAANAPLRHLEYSVGRGIDGRTERGLLVVDILAASNASGLTVDLDEQIGGNDQWTPRVSVDPKGVIDVPDDSALTDEEEAVLYFLSLDTENMTGLGKGDAWERSGALPDGRHLTRYAVLDADGNGALDLQVTRTIMRDDGSTGSWRGRMQYDANDVVPLGFTLNGRIREHDSDTLRTHDVVLTAKLAGDSFKARQQARADRDPD
jgi:hypothetical protein